MTEIHRTLAEIVELCEKHIAAISALAKTDDVDAHYMALWTFYDKVARDELPRLAKVLQKVSAVGHVYCSAFPDCPSNCPELRMCEWEIVGNAFREAGVTP